jgi:hypothetical protein
VRLIAIVSNVLLLATAFVLLWNNGLPDFDDDDFFLAILVLIAPFSSLSAILRAPSSRSLATLYLQRKALEEEAKIAALKANAQAARK